LFHLLVNDVGQYNDKPHDDGSSVSVSYSSNDTTSQTVSFVMYAEDLTLFDNSAGRLQVLVDRVASYAKTKFDCERPEMYGDCVQDTKNAQFTFTH
jgi:hypothetical protein